LLLYEAEFIRSLLLVLEDTPEATVGVIINHPMSAAIECKEGEDPLPLRYGGPIDVPSWRYRNYHDGSDEEDSDDDDDDDDEEEMYEGFADYQSRSTIDEMIFDNAYNDEEVYDDDSSFIWIHRDAALGAQGRDGGGGSRLGTSDLWIIKEDDALTAIQSGILSLKDTNVFSGVCIWEKGTDLGVCGGGVREQIDVMQSLEVVRSCNDDGDDDDAIDSVWEYLSKHQNVLTKKSLESNMNAAIKAWEICSDSDPPLADQQIARVQLADAAVKAWIARNLLDDPLGTLVEVNNTTIISY